jgi:hypothetical protein
VVVLDLYSKHGATGSKGLLIPNSDEGRVFPLLLLLLSLLWINSIKLRLWRKTLPVAGRRVDGTNGNNFYSPLGSVSLRDAVWFPYAEFVDGGPKLVSRLMIVLRLGLAFIFHFLVSCWTGIHDEDAFYLSPSQ